MTLGFYSEKAESRFSPDCFEAKANIQELKGRTYAENFEVVI